MFYYEASGRGGVRVAPNSVLSDEEHSELIRPVRSKFTSVRLVHRARIVFLAAEGKQNKAIAAQLSLGRVPVARWRERYAQHRLAGIERDRPRGAPAPKVDVARLVKLTTQSTPAAATHWSTRTMAAELGISAASVSRHWRANGLKPHRVRGFKISPDPQFVQKLEGVVALYMSPPEHALVPCCDEKSQVKALNRTQPGLPLTFGKPGTRTHDYKPHGTTSLSTAQNLATGKVIREVERRYPSAEFPQFLKAIDAAVPTDHDVHLIMDNYGTHKTEEVRAWFAAGPRYHVHLSPTSASWLNLVERFFGQISVRWIKQNAHTSVADLKQRIRHHIDTHNAAHKPFVWRKTADAILASVARAATKHS